MRAGKDRTGLVIAARLTRGVSMTGIRRRLSRQAGRLPKDARKGAHDAPTSASRRRDGLTFGGPTERCRRRFPPPRAARLIQHMLRAGFDPARRGRCAPGCLDRKDVVLFHGRSPLRQLSPANRIILSLYLTARSHRPTRISKLCCRHGKRGTVSRLGPCHSSAIAGPAPGYNGADLRLSAPRIPGRRACPAALACPAGRSRGRCLNRARSGSLAGRGQSLRTQPLGRGIRCSAS